ncbi:natural killer cell receptor 2B4 [Amazona aestiva]|uniref:Natural killer cell receptor 2B4 n=1 Tax=Amazona aestiva TaxID=12930 RepID=A0A0Q3U1H0_AMAAE|nr:natural killer cell receptor 2B4 [Amazona aestiva]
MITAGGGEPLQPPHVETVVLHEERGWCNLSLLCTAPGADPVSYSWSCSGDAAGALEPGSRLYRRVHGDADPTVCYCNVSNAVSWSSANVSISAACRAAAAGLSRVVPGRAVTVAVAVAVPVLAIAVAFVIAFCWWRKRRKDPPGGDIEQALTVYEEVGKAQTGRDPSATRNEATSGENTVYAVICKAQSPSLRRKRLDPALVSTAYIEAMGCPRRPPSQIMAPAPMGHHLP